LDNPPSRYTDFSNGSNTLSGQHHVPIIVHCHLRWDFVWQRPQQIFSRLAQHHPILFIEEPLSVTSAPAIRVSEPYPNVLRLVPVLDTTVMDFDEQCDAILPLLYQQLERCNFSAERLSGAVQWFYSPMPAPKMLGCFGEAVTVVYDCMDELANFRFAPRDIAERERLLLQRADVVFTGGYRLFESKSRYHDNTHFFGCGVDVDHYSRARSPKTRLPAEVAGLDRPVFGYFGVIDERIDYELIARLADGCPQGAVVMVGPVVKVDPDSLPSRPNIFWLGQRSYDDLPALVKSFDVCLMPFALNESTQYINPTKTLEYMAAGKPIVSTAVPDVVRQFTPIVAVAHSIDEFIEAAHNASESPDRARIDRGIALAEASSWDRTVASMRRLVLEAADAEPAVPQVASQLADSAVSADSAPDLTKEQVQL